MATAMIMTIAIGALSALLGLSALGTLGRPALDPVPEATPARPADRG